MQYIPIYIFLFCFFRTLTVQSAVFVTEENYGYALPSSTWLSTLGQDSIVFKVAACQEANIALAKYPGITRVSTYEVSDILVFLMSMFTRSGITYVSAYEVTDILVLPVSVLMR